MTTCCGASEPGPSVVSMIFSPRAASVVIGMPRLSPPVRCRSVADSASVIRIPAARPPHSQGRRMMARAKRCHTPVTSCAVRRSSTLRGITRQRFTPRPITARTAGRKVAEAAIETSGTSTPPTPIERMNGTGMKMSSAEADGHGQPENSVARPAVVIVLTSAACGSSWTASSSR